MDAQLDLTREVAEKILKRAMAPLREFLDSERNTDEIPQDEAVELTVGQVRELDRDLGVLGLTLATRYREQVEYQTALGVMSAENTRLHTVVEELVAVAEKYKAEGIHLASEVFKLRNVNNKLKEVITPQGSFHS